MDFKKIVSFFMILSFSCEKVCAVSHLDAQEDRSSFLGKKKISRNSPSRKFDSLAEKGTAIEGIKKHQSLKLEKRKIWAAFLLERKKIQEKSKLERKKIRATQKKTKGLSSSQKKALKKQKKAAIKTVKRKEYIELKQAEHAANKKIAALGKSRSTSPVVTQIPEQPKVKQVIKPQVPAKSVVKPVKEIQIPEHPKLEPVKEIPAPAKPKVKKSVKFQVPEKSEFQPIKETPIPAKPKVKKSVKFQVPQHPKLEPVKEIPAPAKSEVKLAKEILASVVHPTTSVAPQPVENETEIPLPQSTVVHPTASLAPQPVENETEIPLPQSIVVYPTTSVAPQPVENETETPLPQSTVVHPTASVAPQPVENETETPLLQPVNMSSTKEEEDLQPSQQEELSSASSWTDESQEEMNLRDLFGAEEEADKEEQPVDDSQSQSVGSVPVIPQLPAREEMEKDLSPQPQSEQLKVKQDDKSQVLELASQPVPTNGKVEEETKPQLSQQEVKLREEQQLRQEKEKALKKCEEAGVQFEELERKEVAVPFSKANKYVKTKEERDNAIKHKMRELYAYVRTETSKIQHAELGKKSHEATESFALYKKTYQDSAVNYFAWLNGEPVQEAEHVKVHESDKVKETLERQFLEWLKSANPQKEDLLKTLAEKFLEEQKDPARKFLIQGGARIVIKKFVTDTDYTHQLHQITSAQYKKLLEEKGTITLENKSFKMTFVESTGDKKEFLKKKVLKRILKKAQDASPVDVHIFSDSSQEGFRFILLGDEKYAAALLLEPIKEGEPAKKGEPSEKKKKL